MDKTLHVGDICVASNVCKYLDGNKIVNGLWQEVNGTRLIKITECHPTKKDLVQIKWLGSNYIPSWWYHKDAWIFLCKPNNPLLILMGILE